MKRFYEAATVEPAETGWRVKLDGRDVRTQGGRPQIVPTRALGEALAGEWSAQGEEIDTNGFPLRDLADYTIDAVQDGREALIRELTAYVETDTLCYRAEEGEPLHDRQLRVWEPLVADAESRWDVHFERIGGVIHRPQSDQTITRMAAALSTKGDFTLAAMRMLTSLTASLIVSLAAIDADADADKLWAAANLEEDWQADLWGQDAEAEERRQARFEAFKLAMRFAQLAREDG